MIQRIIYEEVVIATIIRNNFKSEGISFFSQENDSQQLGYMNRLSGYVILPHRHNVIKREVNLTQEVLFVKSGKVRVDFYSNCQKYIESVILISGDVILLADGGHGFKMLEDTEIIEVKQGPYCGDLDKVRFPSIDENSVTISLL